MTNDDYKDLRRRIEQFESVYLLCDGYLVGIKIKQHKMRLRVVVFVNGWIKGDGIWFGKEDEIDKMPDIARRFYFHKRKGRPAKEVRKWEKLMGKRECKKRGLYLKSIATLPEFNTAGSCLAHIKKHNESIVEISREEYEKRLDELDTEANDG